MVDSDLFEHMFDVKLANMQVAPEQEGDVET